jgi:hypothetical protein
MLNAISFKADHTFKTTNSTPHKTSNKTEPPTIDQLSLTPERDLTPEEHRGVKRYVELSALMWLSEDNKKELFEFMDKNNIRKLQFSPATEKAFKEAEERETQNVEKIGLNEKEKQKITEIVENYAQLFIANHKTVKLADTLQFAIDNDLTKLYCSFSILPNSKNREKFYNDEFKQRMNRLKEENPEAYAAYTRVSREDSKWAEALYFSKKTDIENGFKLLFPETEKE